MNVNFAALADIDTPLHVDIETLGSIQALITRAGEEAVFGTGGKVFFGTAFLQGNRLMFSTAMPLDHLVLISHIHRSTKKANVNEVEEHANRPQEVAHAKNLNQYLRDTACKGENWIVSSLTLNFGCNLNDDDEHVRMILVTQNKVVGATTWPAVLMVPPGSRFDITDGAHRESQFDSLLKDAKLSDEAKDRLRQNAVAVNFVFERSRIASHQDFADCAKAKAIQRSLVVTYDIRDEKNRRTRDLVKAVPFLTHYVDATAANVNLSGKSTKIWSMSAMRLFTNHVAEQHPQQLLTLTEKMEGAKEFFEALIKHIPVLQSLEQNRLAPNGSGGASTGALRETRGGNVVLRGVGLTIFARAYLDALRAGIPFEDMAKILGTIDWHVLAIQKPLANDAEYRSKIEKNREPLFAHMVASTESRMKISSSAADSDIAWNKIVRATPELAERILPPQLDIAA